MKINFWEITKDENDVNLLCLVESYEPNNFIIIQFNDEINENEQIEFGWSRYYFDLYLEKNNLGSYSCIEIIEILKAHIIFKFNEKGENIFKIPKLVLEFTNLLDDFEKIKIQINNIFSDDKNIKIVYPS